MFRIDNEAFAGVSKDTILKALKAEGIPVSGGYKPLNQELFLANEFASPAWRGVYGDKTIRDWPAHNECPVNDTLCSQAMWLTQTMLLGPKQDMEHVAGALRKIQSQAASLRGA